MRGRNTVERRSRGWLGFALVVGLPFLLMAVYMAGFAKPHYTSSVAFTVRSAETGAMDNALSGFAQITGGGQSSDALILAGFLESQTLLERLDDRLDLVRHYAEPFDRDPVFALSPNAPVEARLTHWRRMLEVRSDPSSGLLDLRVRAFSPEMAQLIARELLVESRRLLNELDADALRAATAQAEAEVTGTHERLIAARAELTRFRTVSRIFDPNSDFEGRLVVLRHLQTELAEALVDNDLRDGAGDGGDSPRVVALRNRIEAERGRIVDPTRNNGQDYPVLLATHEHLMAERSHAEAAYRTARTALEMTTAQAARRDRYLAVFVQPTLAERADHHRVLRILGLAALFLTLTWTAGTVIGAAIRDRR